MTQSAVVPPGSNDAVRLVSRLYRAREASILLVVALVVVAATVTSPDFLFSSSGWRDLTLAPSILMILAVGEAIVIITRNVDISVGAVLGFTAYFAGRVLTDYPGVPVVVVFLLGTLLGALMGLFNGLLVTLLRVPALVVTLGTLYIFRGIDVLWAGGIRIMPGDLPSSFLDLGTSSILTVPTVTIIAVFVAAAAVWYMKCTRGGRTFYAIGSDPDAARLYGLPTGRRVIIALATSGALAGFSGVLYLSRYATADSQVGTGWELQAIAAVVIGGIAIAGGSGSVGGAALGAVLLITINRALPVLGIPDFWQQAVIGVLILFAIVTDRLLFIRTSHQLLEARETTNA
ncbi:ABC transporter permease [Acrocarpospora catenulata]|uniref:ABC transporter permease n=1 Tax=Acrocarpospora catenulata TaxID=2836182 RepID=UPI001BDA4E94|nr:ABC transporter permease [Acrocarpospora catenulata]